MITEEERQSIINEAVEKALLLLPEVVGNLITNQSKLIKVNREFYKRHPDLADNKDLVASIVEKVDGENPGMDYEEILKQSVPIIRDHIKSTKNLDFKSVTRPNRDLRSLDIGLKSNHGDL